MLDEEQYLEIFRLYGDAMKSTKEFREKWGLPLERCGVDERMSPVRTRYEELTGMKDCHQNAIMNHRLSLYGSPCKSCGKPLRTPKAKLCGACMFPVQPAPRA